MTNESDTTASMVIEALVNHGAVVAQVDTGDFPQRWTVTGRIDSAGAWRGALVGPDVQVDLESVTAIYYRRPSRYRVAAGVSPADRRFAEAEAHHGVGGLLSCLPCRWVSHPARIADASAKPGQLRLAAACGLRVPETLITSLPEQVREFVTEIDGPVVYKPMSPGALRASNTPRAVYATLLDPATVEEWLDPEALGVTANQFQRYIGDKDADLRVTAVGERLFPVAIRARTPAARVGWRRDYDSLDYEVLRCLMMSPPGCGPTSRRLVWRSPRLTWFGPPPASTTSWRPTRTASGGGSPMSLTSPSPRRWLTCSWAGSLRDDHSTARDGHRVAGPRHNVSRNRR
ncbi:MAG TPA: hypothetical protein VK784_10750 [Pseudonocardiaceae bacterium]|nr:hypothetical protein [Pseudonocardiaceae bacterium]